MTDEALDKSSEAYRAACEARHVANLPDDRARSEYLAGVKKARGEEAWRKLRAATAALLREK